MAVVRGERWGASWVASGDLTGAQYKLLTYDGAASTRVWLSTASGAACAGVLQNKPRNGEHAALVDGGHTKLFLGGSMGGAAEFMMNNVGAAIPVSSGGASIGRLHSAGDSGNIVAAIIFAPGYGKTV